MIACVHSLAALGGPPVTLGAQQPSWRFPHLFGVTLKPHAFVTPPFMVQTYVCDVQQLGVPHTVLTLCFRSRFGSDQLIFWNFPHSRTSLNAGMVAGLQQMTLPCS